MNEKIKSIYYLCIGDSIKDYDIWHLIFTLSLRLCRNQYEEKDETQILDYLVNELKNEKII